MKVEGASGENLVSAQGQPVLAFIAWPGVMNGSLWIWRLHRAGRVQSDVTENHGSLVFYCLCPPWPWWEPPVQHEGKGKTINLRAGTGSAGSVTYHSYCGKIPPVTSLIH